MNTKKSKLSQYVKKYIYIFIGSIITAIGLEIFLIPNNIIDGGVVGISIMLSAITGLPFGAFLILPRMAGSRATPWAKTTRVLQQGSVFQRTPFTSISRSGATSRC